MTTIQNGVVIGNANHDSFRYRQKNRKQSDSLTAGALLLMASGMLLVPTIYFQTTVYRNTGEQYTFQTLYFVGTIIGAVAASILLKKLRKVIHYYLAGILAILAGGLFIPGIVEIETRTAGSFFGGILNGLVLLTCITHASEVSVKYLRGSHMSIIQLSLDFGIYIANLIFATTIGNKGILSNTEDPFKIIGIVLVVLGVLSLPATFFFSIESPYFLIEAGNEDEARQNVLKLRKEHSETMEILNDMESIRVTVRGQSDSFEIFRQEDIIPFFKVFLYRFAYVLATALPVNSFLITFTLVYFEFESIWHILFLFRLLGSWIPLLLLDRLGRKPILILSLGIGGILLIAIEAVFYTNRGYVLTPFEALAILSIIYQIFVGMGSGVVGHVFMSEAFDYSRKTYLNAAIIVSECLIHIIIIVSMDYTKNDSIDAFMFIAGIVQILVAGFTWKLAPETKRMSLIEAQESFKNLKN